MKLIVGLGNPGKKYEHTRHNMGFDVLDMLSDSYGVDIDKEAFKGVYIKINDVILFKPHTFMNLSGVAVKEILDFFKIKIEDVLIIYDDMAIPVGKIRLREKGSSGSHKGMQNIIDNLSTEEIKRIRIGIGEPKFNSIDYVLSKPSKEEEPLIKDAQNKAVEAIKDYLKKDFTHAMSQFN